MLYFYKETSLHIAGDTPYVKLTYDDWDDWFTFTTMFGIYYFDGKREISLGRIKIGTSGLTKGRPEIPQFFTKLESNFFSIGSSIYYYDALKSLDDNVRKEILTDLNDIAYDLTIFERYKDEKVLRESLMRDYSYTEIKRQLHRIAHGGAVLTPYEFTYQFPTVIHTERGLRKVDNPAKIEFNVVPESNPASNIHALIGRNGVGKTFMIQSMIKAILGIDGKELTGIFEIDRGFGSEEYDPKSEFANLICVAFSAFDDYPASTRQTSNVFPYIYIGLKQQSMRSRMDDLKRQFSESLYKCLSNNRKRELWKHALGILNYDKLFFASGISNIDLPKAKEEDSIRKIHGAAGPLFGRLSSGHKIILLTIARLIEYVEEKSFIILDEPETHLHPPLLSAFIRALSDILIKRNAVAFIATHSPIVLQEIPSSCAWKIRRSGREVSLRRIEQETFGTNINSLIREAFELEIENSGFHKMLFDALKEADFDFDFVARKYRKHLGDDARAMLKIMSIARRNQNEENNQT